MQSGPLVGRQMEAQQEQQGQAVPAADAASEASSTASTVSAIRHVHDLQLEVNILGHRCIHLEERLRALEDQQSSVQRRLSWLERVVQQIRTLASQLC